MIVIALIIFITMTVIKMFHNEHKISYRVDNYNVEEHFYTSRGHTYDISISNKNIKYIYTINEDLGKAKKIIKDIKSFKSNNLVCIIPIVKGYKSELYCNVNNNQVSNYYLHVTNNKDYKKIYKEAKKYKIKQYSNSTIKTKYKKVTAYKKNIIDNHTYFIWDYKGIYIINNDDIKYEKILKNDLYDNVMDCVVDKYYVLFENTSVNGIENVYYYDIVKDKLNSFKLKTKLSKNSYINGVIDNLIYVTDRRQKKEYTINIKKKEIKEIDNEQSEYIVYDNFKKKKLTMSDFFMQDNYFSNNLIVDKKITSSTNLKQEYNYYYFIEDNKLYKVRSDDKKHRILLTEIPNITDWLINDKEIIIISEDTIYVYSDDYGLRKILTTNELKYNYKNIFDFWKK